MGDRIVIAFFENGEYRISLYDHWGGREYVEWEEKSFIPIWDVLSDIRKVSNDFANFITMFIHWYREMRRFAPEDPYNIYLHLIPPAPDHKPLAYDYGKDELFPIDYDKLLEKAREKYGDSEW